MKLSKKQQAWIPLWGLIKQPTYIKVNDNTLPEAMISYMIGLLVVAGVILFLGFRYG